MLFSHLKVTIHAQGQAPPTDTQIVTRGNLHCQRLRFTKQPVKTETLGASDSLAAAGPCAGGPPQNRRKLKNLFTMSKIEPGGLGTARNREENGTRCFLGRRHTLARLSGAKMVEADGIEPTTFCLQSRCSPN